LGTTQSAWPVCLSAWFGRDFPLLVFHLLFPRLRSSQSQPPSRQDIGGAEAHRTTAKIIRFGNTSCSSASCRSPAPVRNEGKDQFRQYLVQGGDSFLGHLRTLEVQPLEVLEVLEVDEAGVRHLRGAETQFLKCLEPLER